MRNDKQLVNLLKLMQITRAQPQYGYALSGLKKHELSSLAEHHYLVTFIALQLARHLNLVGAKLNVEKVLEICLIHDLGELFGGDISRPYAMANPKARELAKAFEEENQKFLRKYLVTTSDELWTDVRTPKSDEAIVAKIADLMECGHYIKYLNQFKPMDSRILRKKLPEVAGKLKDKIAKRELLKFIKVWLVEIESKSATEILFD
jgi:5'-deoxynucleotidase YfbR-like HD superfamily hydrolase